MPDIITVSVTHEIKIDGEKSWVGLEYATEVGVHEKPAAARQRASRFVNDEVMAQVQETVEKVREVTG